MNPWHTSNANLAVYPVWLEHIIDQSASKCPYDSLKNKKKDKWKNFISRNHYTYFTTTRRKCLNSVNLWNWKVLKTKEIVRLCATLHTIQPMLVHKNASSCSKMSKKRWGDFMTSSNEFYDFLRFSNLYSLAFFLNLTMEQCFKSPANKSNSQESLLLHFFQFWQSWFFSFGLEDDKKSFNAAYSNIFLHFCAVIMDFFIILNVKFSFF